jgi:hypothetical protein
MAEPKFGSLSGYSMMTDEEKARKARDDFQTMAEENVPEEEIYSRLRAKYPRSIIDHMEKPQPVIQKPPTTPLPENSLFRQMSPQVQKEVPSLADYVPGLEDNALEETANPLSYIPGMDQTGADLTANEDSLQGALDQRATSEENRLGKLKLAQALAGNLELVGRGMMGLRGNTDPRELPRQNFSGLEEEIASREDQLSPGERSMMGEAFGVNIPEGMKFSRFEKMAGPISTMAQREASAANQQAVLAGRESRFVRGQQFQNEQRKLSRGVISDAQEKDITTIDASLALLDQIKAGKANFDTGPLAGRWHTMASWLGMNDSEKAAFKQTVVKEVNDTLHEFTGSTITKTDLTRILQQMPNMEDNDSTFLSKLEGVISQLKQKRGIMLENLRRKGKDVSEYATPAGAGAAPSGPVTMVLPDGREVPNIDASQIERFQAKYPGSQPKR